LISSFKKEVIKSFSFDSGKKNQHASIISHKQEAVF
jgi:hypothetical protein